MPNIKEIPYGIKTGAKKIFTEEREERTRAVKLNSGFLVVDPRTARMMLNMKPDHKVVDCVATKRRVRFFGEWNIVGAREIDRSDQT